MPPELCVAALGGNALLRRGEPLEAEVQRENVRVAARALAEIARACPIVVTHGNGPQVGLLALQAEAHRDVRPYPLDVLGAESEGMIGYLIEQELRNQMPDREVATLLTQVEVDPADAAWKTPTKPIGPMYSEAEAKHLAESRGFFVAPDGAGFRRVVPSPDPKRIIELNTIQLLVNSSILVICAGGGGIPVIRTEEGALRGVEAVVDKDASAALLAEAVGARILLLLTDVPAVWSAWRSPDARAIRTIAPADLKAMPFAAGSMAPKVAAACRFVERTGQRAGIGSLADAAAILRGEKGTQIVPGTASPVFYSTDEVRPPS